MASQTIVHQVHGNKLHDLAIYLTERACLELGYTFLNKKPLQDKAIYPGIPDVYVRVPWRRTSERGQATRGYTDYIIEIETNPTSESILKKQSQFTSPANHELIIIGIPQTDSFAVLESCIGVRLP
jgi:hypothetical protein